MLARGWQVYRYQEIIVNPEINTFSPNTRINKSILRYSSKVGIKGTRRGGVRDGVYKFILIPLFTIDKKLNLNF